MKPLVSILIPAYNAGRWLRESVDSALAQTWENKEVIIVDDGSKDDTLQIARDYESRGVIVFTQQNQGAAAARNKAFSLSRGDYIQWLDADDMLAPDKVAAQMALVESGECTSRTLVGSAWGRFLFRYDKAEFEPTSLWCDHLTPAEWLIRKMGQNLHQQTGTWLVTRDLTDAAGPWNTQLLGDDDGEYFCRILLASDSVRFVRDAKVYYRAAGTSSLSYIGHSDRKVVAQWKSMQLHIQYLRSLEDTPRVHEACVRYLQNWQFFFHPERMDIVEEARILARSLGGDLRPPALSWKYSWIQAAFGDRVAKRAQVMLPAMRWSVLRSWDKALYNLRRPAVLGDGSSTGGK